jgi:TRAP-type C4-dicarboxylate transport system permease small subunit
MVKSIEGEIKLPKFLAAARRILRQVGRAELAIAVVSFSAVVVLNIIEITMRYVLNRSIWWSQEVSLMLMMVAYYVGISCVFRMRQYVTIDILVEHLPPAAQRCAYYFAHLCTAIFCLVALAAGFSMVPRLLTAYTVILHVPQFYMTLPLMWALTSMAATTLYYGLAVWYGGRQMGKEPLLSLERELLVEKKT